MSASGFPGKRVEANRAGMTATICSGGPESTAAPVDAGCTTNHNTIVRGRMLRSPATSDELEAHGDDRRRRRHGGRRCSPRRRRRLDRQRARDRAGGIDRHAAGAALVAEIARLRERLRPQARAAQRRPAICSRSVAAAALRDAVASGPRRAARRADPSPDAARRRRRSHSSASPKTAAPDGPVMTAIISSPGACCSVKEGDRVDGALPRRRDLVRQRRTARRRRPSAVAQAEVAIGLADAQPTVSHLADVPRHHHQSDLRRRPSRRRRASAPSAPRPRSSTHGIDGEIFVTERRGHARELARRAVARGARLIVAWGGDGTVNEVASALVRTQTPLWPSCRRDRATAWRASSACRAIRRAPSARPLGAAPRVIDAGQCEGRCSSASPASASTRTSPLLRSRHDRDGAGSRPTRASPLRELLTYRPASYRIDGAADRPPGAARHGRQLVAVRQRRHASRPARGSTTGCSTSWCSRRRRGWRRCCRCRGCSPAASSGCAACSSRQIERVDDRRRSADDLSPRRRAGAGRHAARRRAFVPARCCVSACAEDARSWTRR